MSTPTAGEVVRRALASSVERVDRHDAAARRAEPDAVHRTRVATRRLRSDLRTFRPLLDGSWADALRLDLEAFGAALGRARDADVLFARLDDRVSNLGPSERLGGLAVLEGLECWRSGARDELAEVMCGQSHDVLLGRLHEAAEAPRLRRQAHDPAVEAMPRLLRRPWRRLRFAVEEAIAQPDNGRLHAVRVRAKRVRYAAEALAPVTGARTRRFAGAAETLQDLLGQHQDAVVAEQWLRTWAGGAPPCDVAFAAGVLAGLERAAADSLAQRWEPVWLELRRLRPRTLR
jgi:CHAD domain-containing protein